MNIKKADEIIRQVEDILKSWPKYSSQYNVKTDMQDAIAQTFVKLL
jgi:hypothetical protein